MSIQFVATPSWQRRASRVAEATDMAFAPPGSAGRAPEADGGVSAATATATPADAALDDARGVSGVASFDASDLSVLGPLAPFAESGPVTDLFVNGAQGLWIDRGGGAEHEPRWSADEAEVRALAVRLIARGGRHIDEATPAVDVRLGRGIRVHAVLPPVSPHGTLLSVRVPRAAGFSLAAMTRAGMLDPGQAAFLGEAVATRKNLLVTGAGGTDKTTLLAALLGEAPHRERIVVIEDVAELRISHPHVVTLEARQANLEGTGRVGLDALLREALRMRPDRLVVGECRGPELRELLAALNTGHDGGAGTLHANSLADVPARLEALGSTAGLSPDAVTRQTVSAFDLVLHLERVGAGRRLAGVGRFEQRGDRLAIEAL
ncbi:TadA family conjugal transfer-associated ATPase [Agromyces ramosus]|uniref:Pilus assembly protein CpaF n=1 Tax=Agromyces ramosus TaxID=33879 RepID=A0ABU0RB28_9MICO|nr:TadA family conjugal transfer-associated ATPase [Agromyces ramosus]MDQ0895289.1 pilus assembly protein CpaF [Agromyces ramosus]